WRLEVVEGFQVVGYKELEISGMSSLWMDAINISGKYESYGRTGKQSEFLEGDLQGVERGASGVNHCF
ncbi:hypothetical protein U1Q18_044303, partial [Sarracenia purpurea var. burkii]